MTAAHPSPYPGTRPSFDVVTPADEREPSVIVLRNGHGMEMTVLSHGCTIQSLVVPDRNGLLADVVLGYERAEEYKANSGYFGALVGRYANRIAKGRFELNGAVYHLDINDGVNHLHGGSCGFDSRDWEFQPFADESSAGVQFRLRSADGDNGYPGNVDVDVVYRLHASGELQCGYYAETDAPTIVNLSQHSYWNLAGHDSGDVLDHDLTIPASRFLPVDETLIPLREMRDVEGTAFDFRGGRTIGSRIDDDDEQLRFSHGYDHNFVLDSGGSTADLKLAARLRERSCGRVMEVSTTEPGLQVYAGGMIRRDLLGKGRAHYRRHSGIALETQHFPDSPNRPDFPSVVLNPGTPYHSRTHFRFLVER